MQAMCGVRMDLLYASYVWGKNGPTVSKLCVWGGGGGDKDRYFNVFHTSNIYYFVFYLPYHGWMDGFKTHAGSLFWS